VGDRTRTGAYRRREKGEYRVGYVGKESGTRLSRADVADFMLKQTTDDVYLHQAPVVSY
jgi:hypothetical protein